MKNLTKTVSRHDVIFKKYLKFDFGSEDVAQQLRVSTVFSEDLSQATSNHMRVSHSNL